MRVGIVDHFDSMHFLPNHPKCSEPHGHTYKLELCVEGKVVNGLVIDFNTLKPIIKSILEQYDHKNLNEMLEFPSCENIVESLHKQIKNSLDTKFKVNLKLWEGEGKWAELTEF